MRWLVLAFVALLLVGVPLASGSTVWGCVYQLGNAEHPEGDLIMRFYNDCGVDMNVSSCLYDAEGSYNNYSVVIPADKVEKMHIGKDIPDQNFNYAWDSDAVPIAEPCGDGDAK